MLKFDFTLLTYGLCIIIFFVVRELIIDEIYSKSYGPEKERFKLSVFVVFLQSIINCLFSILFPIFEGCIFSPKIEEVKMSEIEEKEHKSTNGSEKSGKSGKLEKSKKSDKLDKSSSDSIVPPQQTPPSDLQVYFEFSVPAIAQVAAGYVGNKSMEFVDGTTKTVVKSIKPIPIMILSFIFRGHRYHYYRYIAILMVTCGIVFFMLELQKGKTQKEDIAAGWIGFLLCGIGLAMDGIVGTQQDIVREKYKPSASTLMLSTNAWATVLSLIPLWYTNEAAAAYNFCQKHPEVLWELLFSALAALLGNHFIFLMLHKYGSLQTSIVTTVRKFLTILVNTLWLGRSMSWIQILSVIIVFAGLELDNRGKNVEREQEKKDTFSHKKSQ